MRAALNRLLLNLSLDISSRMYCESMELRGDSYYINHNTHEAAGGRQSFDVAFFSIFLVCSNINL